MFDTIRSLDWTQSVQLILAFVTYAIVGNIRESSTQFFMARYMRCFDTFLCVMPAPQALKVILRLQSSPSSKQQQGKAQKRNKNKERSPEEQADNQDDDIIIPAQKLLQLRLQKSKELLNDLMATFEYRHFDYIIGMCISLIILFVINQFICNYYKLHKLIYFTTLDAFFIVFLFECFRLLANNVMPYFYIRNWTKCSHQRYVICLFVILSIIGINLLFVLFGHEMDFKHHLLDDRVGKSFGCIVRSFFCALIAACYSIPGIRFSIAQRLFNENISRKYVKFGMTTYFNLIQLTYLIIVALWFSQVRSYIQQTFDLTDQQFETYRFYFTISSIFLRFLLFPFYILATMEATFRDHITELVKSKASATYNDLRLLLLRVNHSFYLATSHFMIPFILQFAFCLIMFNRGRMHWNPFNTDPKPTEFFEKATWQNFMGDPEFNRVVFGYFVWCGCFMHLIACSAFQSMSLDYVTTNFVES